MKEKVFAEIGFGNTTFLSTEIEKGKKEFREEGFFFPKERDDVYVRFWIFKKVFVISLKEGFNIKSKNRNNLKLVFGIRGFGRK